MHGALANSITIGERAISLSNMYDPAQIEIDLGLFRPEARKHWSQAMLKEYK